MFDAKQLFDQFLGSQKGGAYGRPAGGSGLAGQAIGELARTFGGRAGGGIGGSGGALGGLGGLAGGLGGLGGGMGGLGGGALAGSLAGLLLGSKHGRKLGGSALQLGGMAVVGALAFRAYQNWQAGQQPGMVPSGPSAAPVLPAPAGTPFNPTDQASQQTLGLALLRAMIAAAKADGHIDAEEQRNIFAEIDRLDLDAEAKAFVMDELRAPLDIDAVARGATTPEAAAEIYAASLLAIDVDNAAERGYLAMLAARLKLDDALVQHLHATVEGATEKV